MKKPKLLIADDNKAFTDSAAFVLKDFLVIKAHSPEAINNVMNASVDVVLLYLVFNENLEGLDIIPELKREYPDTPVLILTNYPTVDSTVRAIKSGASDFINKRDLDWAEWKIRLMIYAQSSIQIRGLKQRNKELEKRTDDDEILGNSSAIDFLRRRIKDLAMHSSDAVIFLTGETGTGKNHAANYFRRFSVRSDKPYREFSILELSESLVESELFGHVKGAFTGTDNDKKGLFEQAEGGILFLDEIGDYNLKIQTKILRFIDERVITPVGSGKSRQLDLQLILASNQDIPSLIRKKKFREDLYQRINLIRIELPSLRDRIEDITVLTEYFFTHFKEKEKDKLATIKPEVLQIFSNYPWPGNIRELQFVIWDA